MLADAKSGPAAGGMPPVPPTVEKISSNTIERGNTVDKWQQEFTSKVTGLREEWSQQFETIATDLFVQVFHDFSDFVRQCDMQSAVIPDQRGMRYYKFALCEDAYVMLYFRPRGIDQIESDYECFMPR